MNPDPPEALAGEAPGGILFFITKARLRPSCCERSQSSSPWGEGVRATPEREEGEGGDKMDEMAAVRVSK